MGKGHLKDPNFASFEDFQKKQSSDFYNKFQ